MVFPLTEPFPAFSKMPRPRLFMIRLSRTSNPEPTRPELAIRLSNSRPAKLSGQAPRATYN